MENKYNVSYTPSSDMKGLITLLWKPLKSFNEGEPTYTEEEAKQVVKFIQEYKLKIPKDMSKWNEFRDTLNNKIHKLYGK